MADKPKPIVSNTKDKIITIHPTKQNKPLIEIQPRTQNNDQ